MLDGKEEKQKEQIGHDYKYLSKKIVRLELGGWHKSGKCLNLRNNSYVRSITRIDMMSFYANNYTKFLKNIKCELHYLSMFYIIKNLPKFYIRVCRFFELNIPYLIK